MVGHQVRQELPGDPVPLPAQVADGFRGVSALLFWYGNKNIGDANLDNDRRHFVAAPLFWRFQRGLKRFDFAFLYIGGYNKLKGKKYISMAPFAVWQEAEFGNKRDLWTLGWIRRTDKARRRSAWAVPLALTFQHDDPDKRVFSATPLFWRTRNHLKGSTFTFAGIGGHYDDPHQRNTFAAPLWFRFRDKDNDATTNVVVPLGLTRRSPGRTSVWTLLGGGRKTDDGWAFGILPAFTFAGARRDGRRFGTVAGALWHVRRPATADKPGRSLWLAGPLGYGERRGKRTHLGIVPALTFAGWGDDKHYQVVTPLLWHVRDRKEQRRTLVAGPLYHHKTKDGMDGGLAPLAFWGRNAKHNYGIVPWLLTADVTRVREQQRLTVSPVLVRSKGPDHSLWGALGIAWDLRRGANEHHTAVAPLVYRRVKDDTNLLVTPVGGRWRDGAIDTAVYGPYFRRRRPQRSGWGVLPLVFRDRHSVPGGTADHTVAFPLYFRRRSPSDDLDIWSPLVWRSNVRGEKPRQGLAVVPFYFRQRQPGGVDVDAGVGFFYSRNDYRRTHTLIGGPFFHRLSRKAINTGVFPTTWWYDTVEKRRLLSLPAIFHFEDKTKDSHTTVAVPLWFDRKRPDGRRTWAAFPFVFGGKRFYDHARFSIAPPGYFDIFRLKRNTRFVGYVPFLFRYEKCGFQENDDPKCRYKLWGSFPFFLAGADGQGRRTHAALLYYWDRKPDGYKLYTPVFGINNSPGKTLGIYAGPIVGVKYTNTHLRSFVFPIWYRRKHRLQDTSLTLAAPPLFISRRRKDRRFFEAGLVMWQFRQQHKVSTAVVPPVFYLSHSYAERRLYWVLPLFIRDNQMGKDKAFFTIPVAYTQYRDGEDLDLVQFPLVWHIERGMNQGTFGAFAWWDIRTKGNTFQMVPALYTRWATPENDTKVIGPGLGWWSRGSGPREGDQGWRMLFGLFGAGVTEGRKYSVVFGAKLDRGPAPPPKPKSAREKKREDRRSSRKQRQASRRLKQIEASRAAGRKRNGTQ